MTTVTNHPPSTTNPSSLDALLSAQRAALATEGAPSHARRVEALSTLSRMLLSRQRALANAVFEDFGGRAHEETLMLELLPLLDASRHARRSLARWMKPRRVAPTWFLLPARAYVVHQPKGVVGVIGTWNYPLLLTLGPLIDALAAGNRVMIKPSEFTPRTSELLSTAIADAFAPDHVTVVTGGPEVASAFSALPFDHLLFTGSTRVGSLVMRAASASLTPVTLELGGKSPAIVHESYPIDQAIERILVGKLYNAGQTCVAPDYMLVPRGKVADAERAARTVVPRLYPTLVDNPDYTRILNREHYTRLEAGVREAGDRGARVVTVNPGDAECSADNKVYPPTLVFDVPEDTALLRDEIFGPVLPVVAYDSLADAIAFVNARPRPLALYYFDDDSARISRVLHETVSGGVTINDVLLHLGQHNLPFGGAGASGMGRYHGAAGFETFSNAKGVMAQRRIRLTGFLSPPYTDRTRALIRRMLAWAGRTK